MTKRIYGFFGFLLLSATVAAAEERLRLEDVDHSANPAHVKESPADTMSPEERKKDLDQIIEALYHGGMAALEENRLREAQGYFQRVLFLDPNYVPAQTLLAETQSRLAPPPSAPPPTEKKENPKITPEIKEAPKEKEPIKPPVKPAIEHKRWEANHAKAETLYRDALKASQTGQNETALRLCQEALKFDPTHLQAKRMKARLELRAPH